MHAGFAGVDAFQHLLAERGGLWLGIRNVRLWVQPGPIKTIVQARQRHVPSLMQEAEAQSPMNGTDTTDTTDIVCRFAYLLETWVEPRQRLILASARSPTSIVKTVIGRIFSNISPMD